jgi:hypothetical protein
MIKHHIIISGTGRTGTTFLMQLLTQLGLNTGFSGSWSGISENCNAGMELDIRDPAAPYIIKDPRLCGSLAEVLLDGNTLVDHAIVPMRELYAAAESRRDVTRRTYPGHHLEAVPGGLWLTDNPADQERILALQLYRLIETVAQYDIPLTLLRFPAFIYDPSGLYRKLKFMLKEIEYDQYLDAFQKVVRPDLVHEFKPDNPA